MTIDNNEKSYIRDYVFRQLAFFGAVRSDYDIIDRYLDDSLARSIICFSRIKNKYYDRFDIHNSSQYFCFLYFLANTIFNKEKKDDGSIENSVRSTCDKLFLLNKMVSSADVYYEVMLPKYFLIEHTIGVVIGRAKISEGFMIMQGCTVGGY